MSVNISTLKWVSASFYQRCPVIGGWGGGGGGSFKNIMNHTFILLLAEDFLDFKDCVTFLRLPIPRITFNVHWIKE